MDPYYKHHLYKMGNILIKKSKLMTIRIKISNNILNNPIIGSTKEERRIERFLFTVQQAFQEVLALP